MAVTYEKIATNTLGSAASSVTFSSIPNTYTDLVLIIKTGSSAPTSAYVEFNSDTSALYSDTYISGNGTAASSARNTNHAYFGSIYSTNLSDSIIINFMNYNNTTTFKSFLSRSNEAGNQVAAWVGLYRSTNAISSMTLYSGGNQFASGSTFNLYGIKAA